MEFLLKKLSQDRRALLIILITLVVSYGQLLGMNFWQDDNAVVFKFTHLYEDAGYLGKGVWGEGAYRYTVASYLPIFHLFGYNPLPYFAWAFMFLAINVLAVYFFFRVVLEDKIKAGIAGFIYAAGYIASDGFIRMFNSVLTSLSVVFVCGTIGLYYKFFQTNRLIWYFLSVLAYYLAIEVGYIRTHFLILVIIAAEFIFFFGRSLPTLKKSLIYFFFILLRLSPFVWLFYKWYLINADNRSGQVMVLFNSLLKGEFYNTYSFFATLGNMLLANEVLPVYMDIIFGISKIPFTETRVAAGMGIILAVIFVSLMKFRILSLKLGVCFMVLLLLVFTKSRQIFSFSGLIGGMNEKIALYAGIAFLILCFSLIWSLPHKKLSLLFFFWMVFNLAAYGAYIPIYAYPSDNRYLLQSFIPLIGLLSLWSYSIWEKMKPSKFAFVPVAIVLLYGAMNLYSSVSWQQKILAHRSLPSKRFFTELKQYVPNFPKNSIFYFYIPDKPFAKVHYDNGFSVAQMPEETAIAWRYGLDRYDFSLVNSFIDLKTKMAHKNIPIEYVYAFVANPDQLVNVTDELRKLLKEGSSVEEKMNLTSEVKFSGQNQLGLNPINIYPKNVSSLAPLKITLSVKGIAFTPKDNSYPLYFGESQGSISDSKLRMHYLDFRNWRDNFYKTAKVAASTSWRSYTPELMLDKDPQTFWEADRVAWDDRNQGFTVDLGQVISVGGIFYKNGPASLTPTRFEILTSIDGNNFTLIKTVDADITQKEKMQKIVFDSTQARFIKITFRETQYKDAPGVSEIEIIPDAFKDIDPLLAENFFRTPFSRVNSLKEWQEILNRFWDNGLVEISWKTDFSERTITTVSSIIPLAYDGQERLVTIEIPAGGEKLEHVKITPLTIPGTLTVSKVIYQHLPLNGEANIN